MQRLGRWLLTLSIAASPLLAIACSDTAITSPTSTASEKPKLYGGTYDLPGYYCEMQDAWVNGNYDSTDWICTPTDVPILPTVDGGSGGVLCFGQCVNWPGGSNGSFDGGSGGAGGGAPQPPPAEADTTEAFGCKDDIRCALTLRPISATEQAAFKAFLDGIRRDLPLCKYAAEVGTQMVLANRVFLFDGPVKIPGQNKESIADTHNEIDSAHVVVHISDHNGADRGHSPSTLDDRLTLFKHEMTHVGSRQTEDEPIRKSIAGICWP